MGGGEVKREPGMRGGQGREGARGGQGQEGIKAKWGTTWLHDSNIPRPGSQVGIEPRSRSHSRTVYNSRS